MDKGKTATNVQFRFHFDKRAGRRRARSDSRREPNDAAAPETHDPRISRLLALAHHLEGEVRNGSVKNYAELASRMGITRARVTQILNLLHLAPDIQEAILSLPAAPRGRERISEHHLRPIAAQVLWHRQRQMWRQLKQPINRPPSHS